MPEPNRLRSFGRDTRTRIVPPAFADLTTVARHRRTTTIAIAAAGAAAAIAIAGAGVKAVYGDDTPVPPTHPTHSTRTTQHPASRADSIVDDPKAMLWSVSVLPDRPDSVAVLWQVEDQGFAIAVTDDGFTSRTSVLLTGLHGSVPQISAAGSAFYVAEPGAALLVSPEGTARAVSAGHQRGPLQSGEVLVGTWSRATVALDLDTATTHPLTLPDNAHQVYGDQDLIWTIAYPPPGAQEIMHNTLDWSSDGGRTWSSHPLPSGQLMGMAPIPSPPGVIAVTVVGDVTIPSLTTSVVSRDAGASWQTERTRSPQHVSVFWAATVADGRLIVGASASGRNGQGRPPTTFVSEGTGWSRLSPLHAHLSDGRPVDLSADDLATTTTDHDRFVLYLRADSSLLRSDDGGTTWTEVRAR